MTESVGTTESELRAWQDSGINTSPMTGQQHMHPAANQAWVVAPESRLISKITYSFIKNNII